MMPPRKNQRGISLCWQILTLLLVIAPNIGWGQSEAPAPLPPAAQEALDKGVLAARQQEYLLAIRFFQEARRAAPTAPEVLFNLGLAESKISGRELRAIVWLRAYLVARPGAANAAAVAAEIQALEVRSQINLARFLKTVQQASNQIPMRGFTNPVHFALMRVADLWARSGDFDAALHVANSIQSATEKGDALGSVAREQAAAGDVAGSLVTVGYIQAPAQKSFWLAAIAETQAKAGDGAGARVTLARAVQATQALNAPGPEDWLGETIIAAQAAIAEAQAKAGDRAGAKEALATALKAANSLQAVSYRIDALARVAAAQAGSGDSVGSGKTTALALQTTAGITDRFNKNLALRSIARSQAAASDFPGAKKTADDIQEDPSFSARVQQEIDKAQWGMSAGRTAVDWIQMNDHLFNTPVFLDLGGHLKGLAAGDIETLHYAARDIVDAHQTINRLLNQPRKP